MANSNENSGVTWSQQLIDDERIRIENLLLERYLIEKGVSLPSDWSTTQRDDDEAASSTEETPMEIKLQIAIESLSKMNNVLENRKEAATKLINTLKVLLNETELRIADVQRDAHDFKREVVEGGMCRNGQRYKAENLVRYLEGKLYDEESALDKLRLKNSTYISKKKRLEALLNQTDDSANFHFIDYHQMLIKQKHNKKALESISAKVALRKISVDKAKKKIASSESTIADLKQKMSAHEKKVQSRKAYLARLEKMIEAKRQEIMSDEEKEKEESSCGVETKEHSSNESSEKDSEKEADIMEYINAKKEIYELRTKIEGMKRKIELAEAKIGTKRI